MDAQTLMTGSVGGVSVALIIGVAVAIYKAVNHRRIRSGCCGQKLEVSLDIEATTPNITASKPSAVVKDDQSQGS
jgi:hypothetical protein